MNRPPDDVNEMRDYFKETADFMEAMVEDIERWLNAVDHEVKHLRWLSGEAS